MHRVTAKALVLVLLLGAFAPYMAAAVLASSGMTGDHCARPPLVSTAEHPSGCHHHANSAALAAAASVFPHNLRSKPCCSGHECCRSQVRAQWAQLSLQTELYQSDRVQEVVAILASQSHTSTEQAFRPVRAPPIS